MKKKFKLNNNQINFYKNSGYLVCKNFFSINEIKKIKKWTLEIENFNEVKGKWMKYYDLSIKDRKSMILTRIENFYDYHADFKKFISKNYILSEISKLAGSKVCLFKDKINFKYPGAKGFKAHQDATIWEGMYGIKEGFISMLISIDVSNKKNGCLEVASNYKKNYLVGKSWQKMPSKIEKRLNWKLLQTKPGDIIFFNDYTPHRSADNYSNKKRRIIFLTYNKKSYGNHRKTHFKDKRKNFPPNLERDPSKKYTFHI